MLNQTQFCYRKATVNDANFILNSWLKSFAAHRESIFKQYISVEKYFKCHHSVIINLLQESDVLVATPNDDTNLIYGWICYKELDNSLILHYIDVKFAFRRFGIATALINQLSHKPVSVSHLTGAGAALLTNLNRPVLVDPYAIFGVYNG